MYASVADWPALYQECYEYDLFQLHYSNFIISDSTASHSHLSPGSYLEQAELSPVPKSDDGSIDADNIWDECGRLAVESGVRFGKTMQIQEKMKNLMEEAGFVDVVEKKFKWPIGAWSNDQKLKDIGRWNMYHWKEGLEGWTMALFTRVMGVSLL